VGDFDPREKLATCVSLVTWSFNALWGHLNWHSEHSHTLHIWLWKAKTPIQAAVMATAVRFPKSIESADKSIFVETFLWRKMQVWVLAVGT
jgi:hypothetical protein